MVSYAKFDKLARELDTESTNPSDGSWTKRRPDDRPPPSRALINFILVAGLVAVAVARHERLQYQQVGIQVSPRSVDGESE